MSFLSKTAPIALIPNTGTFMWGGLIRQLPSNVSKTSFESQKLFIEALKSSQTFSMRILKGKEKEEWVKRNWHEIEKTIPKDHWTGKAFILINLAGKIFLFALTAHQVYSRF